MSRLGFDLTWLGHSSFLLDAAPDGPRILIDPFLGNPRAPSNAHALAARATIILATHAHEDHIADVAAIAGQTGATVMASVEVAMEFGAQGVPGNQLIGFNKGGAAKCDGITVTLTPAFHSSSLEQPDGRGRSIGDPCGLVIELPNRMVIYDSGDTCVFGDMALIAEIYRPTVFLPAIGDFYTMGPRQAAKACELVRPQWIVPHHYGTFPALTGTPDALRALLPVPLRERVLSPIPGETIR